MPDHCPTRSGERPREDTASQEESPHQKPGHGHLELGLAACGSVRASCLALGRPPVGFHSGAELRQRRPRRGGRVAVRSWDATPQGSSPLSDHIRPQASAPRCPRQGPPCVSQDALACWPRALGRGFPTGRTQNRTARRGSGFRSPGRGRCRQPGRLPRPAGGRAYTSVIRRFNAHTSEDLLTKWEDA